MPATFSFSLEVTQPFFTFYDHLREVRQINNGILPDGKTANDIVQKSAEILKHFLNVPYDWQTLIESPALEISGQTKFCNLVHSETGEILHPEDHREMRLWDASLAVPAATLTFQHADAWRFATHQGFGVPSGPYVTFFRPGCFTPDHHGSRTNRAENLNWSTDANLELIAVLGRIVQDLERRGLETLKRESKYKAAVLHQAVANHPLLRPLTTYDRRSETLLAIQTEEGFAEALANHLAKWHLRPGRSGHVFSFTNYPAHSRESAEMVADCLTGFTSPN